MPEETGLNEVWYIYDNKQGARRNVFLVAYAEDADKLKVCLGYSHYRKEWVSIDVLREYLIPTAEKFNTIPVECDELPLDTQLTLHCGCVVEKCEGWTPYPSFKLAHACSDFDRKEWNDNGHTIRWAFRWDAGTIKLDKDNTVL